MGQLLKEVSTRSGVIGTDGDGTKVLRSTGIGRFKDGMLTFSPDDIRSKMRRGGGNGGGNRRVRDISDDVFGGASKRGGGKKKGFVRKGAKNRTKRIH